MRVCVEKYPGNFVGLRKEFSSFDLHHLSVKIYLVCKFLGKAPNDAVRAIESCDDDSSGIE
jgi:hypothetical protein